jgi:hypothetical protein
MRQYDHSCVSNAQRSLFVMNAKRKANNFTRNTRILQFLALLHDRMITVAPTIFAEVNLRNNTTKSKQA